MENKFINLVFYNPENDEILTIPIIDYFASMIKRDKSCCYLTKDNNKIFYIGEL